MYILKKTLLLLFFVMSAITWQLKAQTQFSENFDLGVPHSMTQEYITNNVDWEDCSYGNNGSVPCPYNGTGSAHFFENQDTGSQTALLTPVLDLSSGAYMLKFSHVQPEWAGDQNILTVEISTDGGINWTQIVEYTDNIDHWVDELITLDNFSLTATTQIRFIGTNHWGYAIGLDDVVIEPAPSCLPVLDLSVSNITTDSVVVSWTETGNATAWNIEYGPVGFTPGQGTVVAANSNPYTLTGLTSQTAYDYYVQADCGAGNVSPWAGPYTFYTACNPVSTFPYNYGFEDLTPNPGGDWSTSCWSAVPENTRNDIYTSPYRWTAGDANLYSNSSGPATAHSGDVYAYTLPSSSHSGDVAQLKTVFFDMTNLSQPELSFFYHMHGNYVGTLAVDTFDGTLWTNNVWVKSGQQQSLNTDPWQLAIITLSNTVQQIRFRATRGNSYGGRIAIDDITVQEKPSCQYPTDFTATNVSPGFVNLTWTANGANRWNIEYGPTGFTRGTGTLITGVTPNTYSVYNLPVDQYFDFYIQADCGAGGGSGNTVWIGPLTLKTLCGTISHFPRSYGFEDTTSNVIADWSESCWSGDPENYNNDHNLGPYRWTPLSYQTPYSTTGPSYTHSGKMLAYTAIGNTGTGSVTKLFSPDLDLSNLTQPQLVFYYFMYGADMGTLSVETYDGTTWSNVWEAIGEQQTSSSDPWLEARVSIPNTVTQIRFRATKGGSYMSEIALDDITIRETPSYQSPGNVSIYNISGDSATLSWTEFGSAMAWDIEYGPTGFTQGQGITITAGNFPYTLTDLYPNTSYDVYVRSNYSGGDTSNWTGPVTFSTNCMATFPLPYSESFENGLMCWSNDNNAQLTWEINTGNTESGGTGPYSAHDGDYYLYVESSGSSNGDTAVIYSPDFNISSLSQPELSFYYHMYGNGMNPDGSIDVAISTDGGNTFTSIFNEQGNHGNQWLHAQLDLSAYSGTVSFKITGTVSSSADTEQNDFAIDDFSIFDSTNSINELTNITAIYPNPTTGKFTIKSHNLKNAKVFVYSMIGKEFFKGTINKDEYIVNLRYAKSGIYLVKIISENKSYVSKLIIK